MTSNKVVIFPVEQQKKEMTSPEESNGETFRKLDTSRSESKEISNKDE